MKTNEKKRPRKPRIRKQIYWRGVKNGINQKMTLHTNHRSVNLKPDRKKNNQYRDENNKRWIIELFLRDPDAELSAKKEEEFEQRERAKNRVNRSNKSPIYMGQLFTLKRWIILNYYIFSVSF